MVSCNCDISITKFRGMSNIIGSWFEIRLFLPKEYDDEVAAFNNLLVRRRLTQAYVKLTLPHKPRSTGRKGYGRDKGSQNSHTWGHAAQIAEYTGLTKHEVLADAVDLAPIEDFPMYTDYKGEIRPVMHESEWPSHVSNAVIEGMHRIEALIQQNVDPLFKLKEYPDESDKV